MICTSMGPQKNAPAAISASDGADQGERGQTLTEYALILAFVALALVLALQTFGGGLQTIYSAITAAIP